MHIDPTGPGRVAAQAWGSGSDWLLNQVPALLGADDNLEAFNPDGHRLIADLAARTPGVRMTRTDRVFEALVPAILGQKVQATMAYRSLKGIMFRFGERAPGPVDLRLLPRPEDLASLGYHALHPLGVERKRAETIIRAAREATRLEKITSMERERAAARLRSIRGIGVWTTALVLATSTGDPDAVPVGDFHIPNMVGWALAGEPRSTDERMLQLLEPFAGHRYRVVQLLELNGISAPKYGPRLALQTHAGW